MLGALLLLAIAQGPAPERASYWFELWDVPVGVVTLELHPGGRYVYRSRQVFTRGADRRSVARERALQVDPAGRLASGEAPESLWLWRRPPAPGCAPVREELGGAGGEACVTARAGPADRGTLRGTPYRATYGEDGRLSTLELGESRFARGPGGAGLSPPDLLGGGLPLQAGRGALKLEPPLQARPPPAPPLRPGWTEREARAEAARVRGAPAAREDDPAPCLTLARGFLARARALGKGAVMVQGLLAVPAEGRAYPHAWVRVRLETGALLDLDPAAPEEQVTAATHLPLLAGERSGAVWLEALGPGPRRVTRTE